MIDSMSHPILKAAVMLSEKEREFLNASAAVETALAKGQSGVSELNRLNKIAAELARLAEGCSDDIQMKLASFID